MSSSRQARKCVRLAITQEDLVARLQVLDMKIDQSAVFKIENGQLLVFDTEVVTLAEALEVSAQWLMDKGNFRTNIGIFLQRCV